MFSGSSILQLLIVTGNEVVGPLTGDCLARVGDVGMLKSSSSSSSCCVLGSIQLKNRCKRVKLANTTYGTEIVSDTVK